jgi:cell wall-associated NlpC family hydrolase
VRIGRNGWHRRTVFAATRCCVLDDCAFHSSSDKSSASALAERKASGGCGTGALPRPHLLGSDECGGVVDESVRPAPVDAPALRNPAEPCTWIRDMTVTEKELLTGKVETQTIYGTEVHVVSRRGTWAKVVVPSQPSQLDARGYPGWLPSRQLTGSAPRRTAKSVVVRSPTTWVWSAWTRRGPSGTRLLEVSYDTRLPVVRVTSSYVVVTLLGRRQAAVRAADVAVTATRPTPTATRRVVVNEVKKFMGLAYLWGGTSGFGFDCSGLTYAVYAAFGVTLSRDASQQAVHGTPIERSSLLPGDLVFFRESATGPVAHVGLYVGNDAVVDAPHTGTAVRVDPLSKFPHYAGARRYLSR